MVNLARSEAQGEPIDTTIGPFDFIQLTYESLQCGETGPKFLLDGGSGLWYPEKLDNTTAAGPEWVMCEPDLSHHGWTDITVTST
jgi:hypothetical protein